METTERIVEAYVRHVKGWATISNIRCPGQNEIDLIAIDPVSLARYHIEVTVSISGSFSKLTAKPYDPEKMKLRVNVASQRRTVGFFAEKKFNAPGVVQRLKEFGFEPDRYRRLIVTWGWTEEAAEQARQANIELWSFPDLVKEVAESITGSREYFSDDTLRTLNLFIHAQAAAPSPAFGRSPDTNSAGNAGPFWVYENRPNNAATLHAAGCSFCNDGTGVGGHASTANGQWLGPFYREGEAWKRAQQTGRRTVERCGICLPSTEK